MLSRYRVSQPLVQFINNIMQDGHSPCPWNEMKKGKNVVSLYRGKNSWNWHQLSSQIDGVIGGLVRKVGKYQKSIK
jgi:hypothetical protein